MTSQEKRLAKRLQTRLHMQAIPSGDIRGCMIEDRSRRGKAGHGSPGLMQPTELCNPRRGADSSELCRSQGRRGYVEGRDTYREGRGVVARPMIPGILARENA